MLLRNLKFLLIDDDPFIQGELLESLKKMDFTGPFVKAGHGIEALEILKSSHEAPFDFIFCDIYMPKMDGITFLAELKKQKILESPTPIMMLTAENDRKVVVECMKFGAHSYLLKPWAQSDLAKKIVSAWEKVHKP